MWTEDELTKLECKEGITVDGNGSLKENPNLVRQLRIPAHPFLQLGLHDLLLGGKLNVIWVHIAVMGSNSWLATSFKVMVILPQKKDEGMGGTIPPMD